MRYNAGEDITITFDTAPNVTGLTDMEMHGVDLANDRAMHTSGGAFATPATATVGSHPVHATESAVEPGLYIYKIAGGLPVGEYLVWMHSPSNGATSTKIKITVAPSATGDPFYGQAQ